jgi:hypothetical protein
MLMVVASLVALVSVAPVSYAAPGDGPQSCNQALTKDAADAAMVRLKGVFQKVDDAFNGSPTGLDPKYIATLGYFVDGTEVIALGPFQQVGPLGPGASAAIGVSESSDLQAFFEGGLKAAYGPKTTLAHTLPTVSTVWDSNRRATVNSRANVVDSKGRLVAIVRGLGQWYIPCGDGAVPQIDWIHFTLQVL